MELQISARSLCFGRQIYCRSRAENKVHEMFGADIV